MAREVLELSEYDLEIHHIKGTSNGRADALSRRPDYDQGEDDNKDVTVLPDHLFVRASQVQIVDDENPPSLLTIQDMTIDNPVYQQDESILKPWVDPHKLKRIEGLWYKEGRRVVTNPLIERRTLIQLHHDPPIYGHPCQAFPCERAWDGHTVVQHRPFRAEGSAYP